MYFVKRGEAASSIQHRLHFLRCVSVIPGVEHCEIRQLRFRRWQVGSVAQVSINIARCFLAMSNGHRNCAFCRHHVAAGKHAIEGGCHISTHFDDTILVQRHTRQIGEYALIHVLAKRQYQAVSFYGLEFTRGLWPAVLVQGHFLDLETMLIGFGDGVQPVDDHAFLQRLVDLEVVCRHLLAAAPVHDHRLGTEPPRRAGDVDGSVSAAVDDHAAAKLQRCVAGFHIVQKAHGIDDARRIGTGNIDTLGDMGADRHKAGIEAATGQCLRDIVYSTVEPQCHSHVQDSLQLAIHHFARQTVTGDAEAHHAPGKGPRFVDLHLVAEARQVIGG